MRTKVTDSACDRTTDTPRFLHHYRVPAGQRPRAGDKALCGHIKCTPTRFASAAEAYASAFVRCVVCEDLRRDRRP